MCGGRQRVNRSQNRRRPGGPTVGHMPPATAVTIGTFDGVHLGHATLLRRARELVGAGRVVALAFDPHPMTTIRPEATPERLTTFARRAQLLCTHGADEVVQLRPEASLLAKSPEEFL